MKRLTRLLADVCAAQDKRVIARQGTKKAVTAKEVFGKQVFLLTEKLE